MDKNLLHGILHLSKFSPETIKNYAARNKMDGVQATKEGLKDDDSMMFQES